MRKTWKLALASAALVSGVAFTACSSDDEELLSGGSDTTATGETGEVKTAISFAIPHAKTQRSTADYVQQDNNFTGMNKIWLFPFSGLNEDYVAATSQLAGVPQNLGNISNGEESLKTYTNVVLPYGDVAFLLYGETASTGKKNQLIASYSTTPLGTGALPTQINFSLKNIDEPTGKNEFSSALVNLRTAMVSVKTEAEYAGKNDDGIFKVIDKLDNGVSSVAQKQMEHLLSALEIAGHTAESGTEYENQITALVEKISDTKSIVESFYTNNYGDMPVALYTFDWNSSNTSDKITMSQDIVETGSQISYPTSLYYMTSAFPVTYTTVSSDNWGSTGEWTDGTRATISGSTTQIALNKTVNYAVGRLDVKVKANAAVLKANDETELGESDVNVSNDGTAAFTLTGVIVGGQPASVSWDFLNSSNVWKNMVYDNDIITNAANVTFADAFTNIPVSTYVLGLPSASSGDVSKVKIALQLTNNGPTFYGKKVGNEPCIIPTGATFYLVGELDPSSSSTTTDQPKQVFAADYYTTANLNITTLKNAYATLPDLTTAQLEFALKVDLAWKKGVVIDAGVGEI